MKTEMQALFNAIIPSAIFLMIIFIVLYFVLILNKENGGITLIVLYGGVSFGVVGLIFNYYRP
jgi:hypothetical protein